MDRKIVSNKIVTFVPFYGNGNRRFYDSTFYYDDKFIDFQLNLIEKLSTLDQYDFIVKCARTNPMSQFSELIKDWITQKRFSNITYRDDELKNSLVLSYKAIMDFPGSSVLESEVLKINTLVLFYEALVMRDTALGSLEYVRLKKYADIDNGIKIVEHFLNDK